MDELSDFERRLTAGLETYAGRRRTVDALAITRAAATHLAAQSRVPGRAASLVRWRMNVLPGLIARPLVALLVALAIVAILVVGGLGAASVINNQKPPLLVAPTPFSLASPSVAPPSPQPSSSATPISQSQTPFVVYLQAGQARYTSSLWVAKADGSGARELTAAATEPPDVAWSQDGKRLLVVKFQGPSQHLYLADAGDTVGPLVDTGMDTGSATGCTGQGGKPWPCQDGWFSFAPDGQHLAFVRRCTWELPGCYSVATMDLGSGHVTVLSATKKSGRRPIEGVQWSPDGSTIVFSRIRDLRVIGAGSLPVSDIFVIDADGRNLHQLDLGLSASSPDWSNDGSMIAFASDIWRTDSVHESDVYTVRADGTGLRRLTTDGVSSQPAWTGDDRLRFWRSDGLWVMDRDGANATKLPELGIGTDRRLVTGWPSSGVATQPTP